MTVPVLISAAQVILNPLIPLATEQIKLAWAFKKDLKTLCRRLTLIRALLSDAENRRLTSATMCEWLKNIKRVTGDAENVLDEFAYETLRRKLEVQNRMRNKVRNFFSLSNPLAFHLKMAHKVKDINSMLDLICKEANDIGLKPADQILNAASTSAEPREVNFRPTVPFVDDKQVVGRDGDVSTVIDMLLSSDNTVDDLPVIAIVGMGGMGKTTLAQLVYNNEKVVNHFGRNQRMWICVSDDFIVPKLLNQMAQSLTGDKSERDNIEGIMIDYPEVQHLSLDLMGKTSFEIPKENVGKLRTLFSTGNLPKNIADVNVVNHDQCNDGIITGSYSGAATTATTKAMAVVFPALRKLCLEYMPNIEEWCGLGVSSSSTDTTMFFPLLECLFIRNCPELTTIPGHLLSLQELMYADIDHTHRPYLRIEVSRGSKPKIGVLLVDLLEKSGKTLRKLTSIIKVTEEEEEASNCSGLTSLQRLQISRCEELTCLPKGLLQQTLVTLDIFWCPNLIIADPGELCSLPSLQSLSILGCPRLAGWGEARLFCLTSLQTLKIGYFSEELEYFPWPSTTVSAASASASTSASATATAEEEVGDDDTKYHPNPKHYPFVSLVSLTLYGGERVKYLPDQLQHLTTLRDLSLHRFDGLEALPEWLGNLSSLHSLKLYRCKTLMNLPTLEAMQRLTNLQSLKIAVACKKKPIIFLGGESMHNLAGYA
ncbi:hypothetical protein TEA_008790 [Camellia sinensis var. sinensis]|uniref:Rx N-terminal domain-containing protein n=1 Tax=Camellia sinensis var. sinensis TaxID=542762 RepID=A0A4S4F2H4_CAMSN|nr:hypothetical protein TEA_008790 [Camellia sinensis var. sinensis]